MVGHGKAEEGHGDVKGAIGSLRYQVEHDPKNYGHLVNKDGTWKTRDDVKVWWRDSDITEPRGVIKGDLKIGYAQSRNPGWIGPEYGFGWAVGDHFKQPVLIIKTAWGGKSLNVDFPQQFRLPLEPQRRERVSQRQGDGRKDGGDAHALISPGAHRRHGRALVFHPRNSQALLPLGAGVRGGDRGSEANLNKQPQSPVRPPALPTAFTTKAISFAVKRLNPVREDLRGTFDYLDLDDYVSFGGVA